MYEKDSARNKNKVIAIDFFCGCGGVTNGMKKAGVSVLAGFDNDSEMQFAYEENNKPARFFTLDINKTKENVKAVNNLLNNTNRDILIFSACAPCQPFSLHNNNHKGDRRKSLMLKFIDVIDKLCKNNLPDVIFAENVGPMKKRGKTVIKKVLRRLAVLGYVYLEPKVINASKYGIPQNRKRLIFVAIKQKKLKKKNIFAWNYFERISSEENMSVRKAIGNLPVIAHNYKINKNDPLHITRKLSPDNLRKLKKITKTGSGREMWDKSDNLPCYKKHDGHKDVYGRMHWDKPAPTLTCRCNSISNGRFGHPDPKQHRAISLREAAILQTMDNYKFQEPIIMTKVARQIGNAVPPKLAMKFAQFILELV